MISDRDVRRVLQHAVRAALREKVGGGPLDFDDVHRAIARLEAVDKDFHKLGIVRALKERLDGVLRAHVEQRLGRSVPQDTSRMFAGPAPDTAVAREILAEGGFGFAGVSSGAVGELDTIVAALLADTPRKGTTEASMGTGGTPRFVLRLSEMVRDAQHATDKPAAQGDTSVNASQRDERSSARSANSTSSLLLPSILPYSQLGNITHDLRSEHAPAAREAAMRSLEQYSAMDLLSSPSWTEVIAALEMALGDALPSIGVAALKFHARLFEAALDSQMRDIYVSLAKHVVRTLRSQRPVLTVDHLSNEAPDAQRLLKAARLFNAFQRRIPDHWLRLSPSALAHVLEATCRVLKASSVRKSGGANSSSDDLQTFQSEEAAAAAGVTGFHVMGVVDPSAGWIRTWMRGANVRSSFVRHLSETGTLQHAVAGMYAWRDTMAVRAAVPMRRSRREEPGGMDVNALRAAHCLALVGLCLSCGDGRACFPEETSHSGASAADAATVIVDAFLTSSRLSHRLIADVTGEALVRFAALYGTPGSPLVPVHLEWVLCGHHVSQIGTRPPPRLSMAEIHHLGHVGTFFTTLCSSPQALDALLSSGDAREAAGARAIGMLCGIVSRAHANDLPGAPPEFVTACTRALGLLVRSPLGLAASDHHGVLRALAAVLRGRRELGAQTELLDLLIDYAHSTRGVLLLEGAGLEKHAVQRLAERYQEIEQTGASLADIWPATAALSTSRSAVAAMGSCGLMEAVFTGFWSYVEVDLLDIVVPVTPLLPLDPSWQVCCQLCSAPIALLLARRRSGPVSGHFAQFCENLVAAVSADGVKQASWSAGHTLALRILDCMLARLDTLLLLERDTGLSRLLSAWDNTGARIDEGVLRRRRVLERIRSRGGPNERVLTDPELAVSPSAELPPAPAAGRDDPRPMEDVLTLLSRAGAHYEAAGEVGSALAAWHLLQSQSVATMTPLVVRAGQAWPQGVSLEGVAAAESYGRTLHPHLFAADGEPGASAFALGLASLLGALHPAPRGKGGSRSSLPDGDFDWPAATVYLLAVSAVATREHMSVEEAAVAASEAHAALTGMASVPGGRALLTSGASIPWGRVCASLVEALVIEELPGVACCFARSHFSIAQIVAIWLGQCFWDHLDFPHIASFAALVTLGGPEYEVFFVLALLRHVEEELRRHTQSRDLALYLLSTAPLGTFSLAPHVDFVLALASRHGELCRSALANCAQ